MVEALIEKAKELGFVGIGFSRPGRPPFFDKFTAWLSNRKHADMAWIESSVPLREDPAKLLDGCQTIISLAYPYPHSKPRTPDGFCVSRHADPTSEDYHNRLRKICSYLSRLLKEIYEGSRSRICVDSAPILEKSIACASGIGFLGKNTLLILPGQGSFVYLAEILSTALIAFPPPHPVDNQCGSCSLCVNACPTGALERPFYLDAARCLSYLTIEYRGKVAADRGETIGESFFGCDRCQEVCPFNGGKSSATVSLPPINDFLAMDEKIFDQRFGWTTLGRAGLEKLKTNIQALTAVGEPT